MSKYQSYTAYASLWNKSFPSHWSVLPMYALAKEKSICGCVDLPLLSVYLDVGVIPFSAKAEKRTNVTSKDLSKYQRVDCGDFVLNNQQAWRGSVGISFDTGIVSPAYIVLSMDDMLNSRYANYLLRSRIMVDQYLINSKSVGSIQRNIYWPALKRTSVPVPPREEQDQIVCFLDWKVSSINNLIRIRKRQIEELEAIKRSSIGYLVMGQAQSIPQRDTEVNWVKTIPAHWNEKTLIQVAEEQQIKNAGMVEDNLLSLSYGKIINKDINTTDGLLPSSFEGYQIVHDGNIILRLTDLQNDHKSLRTGLVTQTGIITSAYTCLKVRHNILPEYLQLQLHVADLCKVFYGMGGGVRQSIGFTEIRKLVIAIPPVEEQQYILDRVHGIEKPINCAIQNIRDIIAGLEDLKTRLISDAVTGKIDVRGIEIPEYEFVDEDIDNADENSEQGADEPPEEE